MKRSFNLLVCTLLAGMAFAAETYVYHGAVSQDNGADLPVNTTLNLTFRLYEQAEGGEARWEEGHAVTCDAKGNFVVALGETTPGLEALFSGTQATLYLGVAVEGTELSPRQRLLAVPTVYQADEAAYAYQDFPIDGAATVGTLATETLSAATVTTASDTPTEPALTAERAVISGATEVAGVVTIGGAVSVPYGMEAPAFGGYAAALPGMIVPWYRAPGSTESIPAGWAVCDGTNGTPDLRDHFVLGAGGNYTPQTKGGAHQVTLSANELPAHTHTFSQYSAKDFYEMWWWDVNRNGNESDSLWANDGTDTRQTTWTDTDKTPSTTKAHENRPPYYALLFIMRLK